MNLLHAAEFKVGLLVVSVATLIAFMSMQVSDNPTYFGKANEAWFMLPDAGGLVKGSQVRSNPREFWEISMSPFPLGHRPIRLCPKEDKFSMSKTRALWIA